MDERLRRSHASRCTPARGGATPLLAVTRLRRAVLAFASTFGPGGRWHIFQRLSTVNRTPPTGQACKNSTCALAEVDDVALTGAAAAATTAARCRGVRRGRASVARGEQHARALAGLTDQRVGHPRARREPVLLDQLQTAAVTTLRG